MHIPSHRKARRSLALSLVTVISAAALATDQPPSPPPPERTLDSIPTNLTELELIKRGLSPTERTALGASIEFSRLETEASASGPTVVGPLGPAPTGDETRSAWRQENWLLAGMQDDHRSDATAEELEPDREDELNPTTGSSEHWLLLADQATQSPPERPGKGKRETEQALPPQIANPLDDFMAGWLDASLSVAPQQDLMPAKGPAFEKLEGLTAGGFGNANAKSPAWSRGPDRASHLPLSIGSKRTNPYADGLLAPPALRDDPFGRLPAVGRAPEPTISPSPPPATPTLPVESFDAAHSAREPWRPPEQDDDKYFRRLNRF